MKIFDELKRISRAYEEDPDHEPEEDEELDDAPPSLEDARNRAAETVTTVPSSTYNITPSVKPMSTGTPRPLRITNDGSADRKVVAMSDGNQLKVVLVKPKQFDEASTIADHLRDKRTVVLNLEDNSRETARRLLDFLSGVAYALEGKIRKVAQATYIITPYNVDFVGDLLDELERNSRGYF